MYGWLATLVVAAALSALLWNSERRLGNAQQEVARLEVGIDTAVKANKKVRGDLKTCEGVNIENSAQRDAAILAAELAADRTALLENELESLNDETFVPTDMECRTLVDPLPADFVDFLCLDEAKNCSRD